MSGAKVMTAKLLILIFPCVIAQSNLHAASINFPETDLIYGSDDRFEVDEYSNYDFIEKAKSVAIRVADRKLTEDREDTTLINFAKRKLKKAIPQICSAERFVEQVSLGDCSGFLIAPNKLITAGHCMTDISECSSNKWIFDFKSDVSAFKKSNVYSCKKIIAQKYVYTKGEVSDYAIIELDRLALGRTPLTYRKFGMPHHETPLVVIGHPLGLPMKIADGGRVARMNDDEREHIVQSWFLRANYFNANLDSYGGNSGSPVFNKKTGKVEGILVQGAEDFVFNEEKECLESRHLSDSYLNTYEKVMRITKIPGL